MEAITPTLGRLISSFIAAVQSSPGLIAECSSLIHCFVLLDSDGLVLVSNAFEIMYDSYIIRFFTDYRTKVVRYNLLIGSTTPIVARIISRIRNFP